MGERQLPQGPVCKSEQLLNPDDDMKPAGQDNPPGGVGSSPAEAVVDETEFNAFVEKNLPRNFVAHFVHGMLGMTGFRLIMAPTFVPTYLHLLTGSAFMVGLGQTLLQVGAIVSPMLVASQIEHRRQVMPIALFTGVMMRLQILGLALAGWFLGGPWLIAATMILLATFGFFMGSQRVAFQAVMAKVIPIRKRGRLQAIRNIVGGAIAAALSLWAGAHLIENNVFGNGYASTFGVSFILTSLGLVIIGLFMREPDAPSVRAQVSLKQRLKELPYLLKDKDYAWFLVAQVLAMGGRVSIPFCILHAGDRMELDGAAIGLFSLIFLGADTLSNLVWGVIGDKSGFRLSFLISVMVWLVSMIAMVFAQEPWHFMAAFFGLGAALSGYMMSATTLVLEFGSRVEIPMRLAASTTVETSVSSVGPLIGGLIAALFGFVPLFMISIVCLAGACSVLIWRVKEPRLRNSA